MRALVAPLCIASVFLLPRAARAQEPADVGRLFSHEADVGVPYSGPFRVALGIEVLAQCQPDLSDVRLYDGDGREIPWLLDGAGRDRGDAEERLALLPAPALETTRSREGSSGAPTGFRESYVIAPPGDAPPRAAWDLVFDVRGLSFVAAVRVIALEEGSERELISTSVYRMQAPTRERARFAVPGTSSARLRVEITGQDGFLEPSLGWQATRELRGETTMTVPLEITERRADAGQTVLVVRRPPGMIPDRLRFSTSTPAFARALRIDDTASYSGQIHRVPTVRDAESIEVPVSTLHAATFTITIDDGDSPPLADLRVEAILSQPSLVFFEPVTILRFGGGRVRAPRYDLDALSGSWMIDRLVDGTTTPIEGVVGPARPSPSWDPAPALAFLHRPGVQVPSGEHRFMAPLTVGSAPEGASRFLLTPEALSALTESHADLRIVDAGSRQWPYLVSDHPTIRIPLTASAPTRDGEETRYALALPVDRVRLVELRLVSDAELVSRTVRVVGIDARGDEVTVGGGSLLHTPGQTEPMTITLSQQRVEELTLVVNDGDESPLTFSSIEASLETSEIFLVAPPGEYRVLLGDEDAHAASYDIARARELLAAIPPAEAVLGALAADPAFHEPGLVEAAGAQTIALWIVLILAVLVLGGLTLRASREPEAESQKPEKEEEKTEEEPAP